jgi:hypothetical protein
LTVPHYGETKAEMKRLIKKLIEQLSLDTEDGVAAVEYAVIVGLVVGGTLVWFLNRSH